MPCSPFFPYTTLFRSMNEPVYFHEFAAHAKRFGLRFVADAEANVMDPRAFPPAVAGVLNGMAARDVLLKEQYLDFLRDRKSTRLNSSHSQISYAVFCL